VWAFGTKCKLVSLFIKGEISREISRERERERERERFTKRERERDPATESDSVLSLQF
jgi:hypothetical protein